MTSSLMVGFAGGSGFTAMVVAFGDEGRHRRCRGLFNIGEVNGDE